MKKLVTLISALSIVVHFSAFSADAQGKGQGRGPAAPVVGQSHGASSDHSSSNGKGDDHSSNVKPGNPGPKDPQIVEHIDRNPELNARITKLLPQGMDLNTAAMGFKNQGQFIAALHVSNNLNIPFDQLRNRMTGPDEKSLGQAIHELRPTFSLKEAEVQQKKAEDQAKATQKTTSKRIS